MMYYVVADNPYGNPRILITGDYGYCSGYLAGLKRNEDVMDYATVYKIMSADEFLQQAKNRAGK